MAFNTTNNERIKLAISLPKTVLERLDAPVPPRRRSRFIAEVVAERLILLEQQRALEERAGTWSDEGHPELQDEAAIDRWLADRRRSWIPTEAHDNVPD